MPNKHGFKRPAVPAGRLLQRSELTNGSGWPPRLRLLCSLILTRPGARCGARRSNPPQARRIPGEALRRSPSLPPPRPIAPTVHLFQSLADTHFELRCIQLATEKSPERLFPILRSPFRARLGFGQPCWASESTELREEGPALQIFAEEARRALKCGSEIWKKRARRPNRRQRVFLKPFKVFVV
jgi:hypothetical protein